MMIRTLALASAFALYGAPALAEMDLLGSAEAGRALGDVSLNGQRVEFVALSASAAAQTSAQRRYLAEARDMRGAFPDYPQPALVTMRMKFRF